MVPKMILLLGFVGLVGHIASSILARLVALSELSAPSGRAHPEFSIHTAISMQAAGSVLWRTTACDRVW